MADLNQESVDSPAKAFEQVRTMWGETVALYGTATKQLLYPISTIKAVYGYDKNGIRIDFKPGIDYVQDGTGIRRGSGSAIYDFNNYAIAMKPDGVTFTWVDEPRNPPLVLYFQVYVDYTASIPIVTIPALATAPITKRILAAGDSITQAAHTIAQHTHGLDADGFLGLMRKYFQTRVSISSFSIAGSSLTVLQDQLPTILADPPGVQVIAFGMNDHAETNQPAKLTEFTNNLTGVVNNAISAGTQVILVGFPAENPAWENYSLSRTVQYNAAIASVASGAGVPFVDIYAAFEQAKMRKEFIDLFGDNYHHPGNFGQRLYFSKILPYLLTTPMSSADVPEFVVLSAD